MALANFVAGAYNGTYNAVALPLTDEGYTLDMGLKQENIDQSDQYGDTLMDYIYRGGDASIEYTSKAYSSASIAPMWPWAALGQVAGTTTPVGRLASDVAQALVLTAVANTPAAVAGNACTTFTAGKAILAPNYNPKLLFNSKLRKVPVKLQLLPYVSGVTVIFFTLA